MNPYASPGIEVETRVKARPDAVFPYFTDPTLYRRWMGDEADLEARAGGTYRVRIAGRPAIEGTYLVVEPPHRLVFTWGWVGSEDVPPGSSIVEVTFVPEGEATVIRLVHRGLPSDVARAEHTDGWRHYLGRLSAVVTGN